MVEVIFIEFDGTEHMVDARAKVSLMENARLNSVPGILADCGGACACATCHVMIDESWRDKLPPIGSEEETMLEFGLEQRTEDSRLSCQIQVTDEMYGLVARLPESQV